MRPVSGLPSPSTVFNAYASLSGSIMLVRAMVDQLIPRRLQNYVVSKIRLYFQPGSSRMRLLIEQADGMCGNELYNAAETYLCTKIPPKVNCLKLSKRPKDSSVTVNFARDEIIFDFFQQIELRWHFICSQESFPDDNNYNNNNRKVSVEKRYFELSFEKEYKDIVINSYVPFVIQRAKQIKAQKKVVKLHALSSTHSYSSPSMWDSINLDHPSTFDTIALDPKLKKRIIEDLDRFVRRKDFYRKVGKAWKRGYLLYGPPGTGKSSLIAAIANYLKFDIYDLDLSRVTHDSTLKKLFLGTSNRSIIVIEDIDCTVKLPQRHGGGYAYDEEGYPVNLNQEAILNQTTKMNKKKSQATRLQFTLSGLLNFIDGLWSSCGDERIIIFTTNDKSKLDPALLRPGRMDMHIHMSYLTPDGFKTLVSNYLDCVNADHPRLGEIDSLIKNGVEVTPAEVAEELMTDDVDVSLEGVANLLNKKKRKIDELEESKERDGKGSTNPRRGLKDNNADIITIEEANGVV